VASAVGCALAVSAIACAGIASPAAPAPGAAAPSSEIASPVPASPLPAAPEVLVAAGDIALCGGPGTEATARLLDRLPGYVAALGDNTYPDGTWESYRECYGHTWGRHLSRTFPAPGNHDWEVSGGAPYFAYFGAAAGPLKTGYYSLDLGNWHILSLNSNLPAHPGTPQFEWARNDLAQSASACTLAFWHHPRFSSGTHGDIATMDDMWRLLQSHGAEIALTGHDHDYERFAPQDADGRFDPSGIREFVVGTGGSPLRGVDDIKPNSEVRDSRTWGVLKLTLAADSYEWEFVPVDGQPFSDTGSAECH